VPGADTSVESLFAIRAVVKMIVGGDQE